MKKTLLFLMFFSTASIFFSYAQNDCVDAFVVCRNSGYENLGVSGFGVQEVAGTSNCGSGENNSIWFDITVSSAGTLAFTLTSESTEITEGSDFFIYGPNADCNTIGQAIPCSTKNPVQSGLPSNLTGLSDSETDTSEGSGSDGNSFVSSLDVNVGDRFYLVVYQPVGTSNFSLEWTGSATFDDLPVNSVPPGKANLVNCDTSLPLDDDFDNFDLTVNNAAYINGQANVDVNYHLSEGDAITNQNTIANPANYKNISNVKNIHVRFLIPLRVVLW